MQYIGYLGPPGGAEWLCMLAGVAVIGVVVLLAFRFRGKPGPPVYVPRICGSCGKGNIADARFCAYCGRELV